MKKRVWCAGALAAAVAAGCVISTETVPGEAGPQGEPGESVWQQGEGYIYYDDGRTIEIGSLTDTSSVREGRINLHGNSGAQGENAGISATIYMYDVQASTQNNEVALMQAGLLTDTDTGRLSFYTKKRDQTSNSNAWRLGVDIENGATGIGQEADPRYGLTVAGNASFGKEAVVAGNINEIWTQPHVDDLAGLYINYRGFNDGYQYPRDLFVGDGKGNVVLSVTGSTGKVGIGGSSPDHTLEVNGDVEVATNIIVGGQLGIGVQDPAYGIEITGCSSGGCAGKPDGENWTITSDRRLKKNISPLPDALSRLLRLRGVTYEWIDPAKHGGLTGPQAGMIAQDVEQVFPEWVGTDKEGYKTLTIRGFEALAVEALRTLRTENEALLRKVDELTRKADRISKLEADLTTERATREKLESRLAALEAKLLAGR